MKKASTLAVVLLQKLSHLWGCDPSPLELHKVLTSSHQFGLIFFITNLIIFHTSARKEKPIIPMEELVCQLDGERHHIYLKRKKAEEAIKLRHHPLSLPTPNVTTHR